jgi:hypothetical protein
VTEIRFFNGTFFPFFRITIMIRQKNTDQFPGVNPDLHITYSSEDLPGG